MSKIDDTYMQLCTTIFAEGREYENKNRGVKRLQIPSYTLRHDFKDGFPALSLKRIPFKWIVAELIWFLRGDNDVKFLNENGVDIWNKDAYNWYKKKLEVLSEDQREAVKLTFEEFCEGGHGSVGQNYSVQWRNFNGKTDQIVELIKGMKKDIMSSRLKVNAWNPSELDETALPPCHSEFQVIGIPLTLKERTDICLERYSGFQEDEFSQSHAKETFLDDMGIPRFGFELHWNQRSVDTLLGLPFNIASYALLAKILEHITGHKALGIEGTLKCVHFYDNQYETAQKIVDRVRTSEHANCTLLATPEVLQDLRRDYSKDEAGSFNFKMSRMNVNDFKLDGYTADDVEKVEMLAPKEI